MGLKNLQQLCLSVVIEHFERFNSAFVNSKDVKLKRSLEFLQRCYANETLRKLSEKGAVKEEWFPLVMNKYLTNLHFSVFNHCDKHTINQVFSEIGEGIQEIYFCSDSTDHQPAKAFDAVFSHLKNLKNLSMFESGSDDILNNVAKFCPRLIKLDISHSSQVTSQGIKQLCKRNKENEIPNAALEKLDISEIEVTKEVVRLLLTNLNSLKELHCKKVPEVLCNLHKQNTDKEKTYKLKNLDLLDYSNSPHLSEFLNICAKMCPEVDSLNCPIIVPKQLDLCARFSKLQDLTLERSGNLPHLNANDFLKLIGAKLTLLELNRFSLSVVDLSNSCPHLSRLSLTDIAFHTFDENVRVEFKVLKNLLIERVRFDEYENGTKSVNAILSSSPALKSFNFDMCRISSPELKEGIIRCCRQSPIKHIDFTFSEVHMDLLQSVLASCSSLKSLTLSQPLFGYNTFDIPLLNDLASNLRNKPTIVYDDDDQDDNDDGSDSDGVYLNYDSDYSDENVIYDSDFLDDFHDQLSLLYDASTHYWF